MSDLKPLGSEKLSGDDKLKRIMEIANYGRSTKNSVTENKNSSIEFSKESNNGTYGIVREKDGYYVKKGLNESTLDYIGGIFMKNKNRFKSYAEAFKRLELISGQESLNEAKKYVLKSKSKPAESVAPEAPIEDIPAPVAEPEIGPEPEEAPVDDLPPADAGIEGDEEMGGEDDGKRSDYMAEVQKFSGKLGQSLRDVKERMESDDIKYVINMVLSAVNLDSLDEDDREEIAEKFEPKDEDFGGDELPSVDDELPSNDGEEGDEEEVDEIMDKLESFVNDEPTIQKEELPEDEKSIEDYADLSVKHEEEVGEMETYEGDTNEIETEIDLDELKSEINKHVDETISKYFE
jgi:hypothetical protein